MHAAGVLPGQSRAHSSQGSVLGAQGDERSTAPRGLRSAGRAGWLAWRFKARMFCVRLPTSMPLVRRGPFGGVAAAGQGSVNSMPGKQHRSAVGGRAVGLPRASSPLLPGHTSHPHALHSPGRSDQCPNQLTPPCLPSSGAALASAAAGAERGAASSPSRLSNVLRLLSPSGSLPLLLHCTRRL